MLGTPEAKEENLRRVALLLFDLDVAYLYEEHFTVSETKGVYTIEALAHVLEFKEGKYINSDKKVVFYLDKEGNPLYENIWRIAEE